MMMGYLAIDQLKANMVLADDVTDMNARLLLAKGSKIQPCHIKMFKMWGIGEVPVDGDHVDKKPAGQGDPELMNLMADRAKTLFKMNDLRQPLIKEIFTLSVLHHSHTQNSNVARPPAPEMPSEASPSSVNDIRKTIDRKNIKLPEIPSIVYELNDIIADPFSSADDIAGVVSKSPSLASLLLRLVNSAFYGFPSKIDSIARAVTIIGSKEISALGMGISTMKLFREIPRTLVDVQAFFKHSLACGILARVLAAQFNVQHTEQLFVAGLLHDIGRVIIFKYFPKQAHSLLVEAQASGALLHDLEPKYLGCRHTHVGRDLFNKWKLPYSLENITYYHHAPSRAPDPLRAGIVHLADVCAHGLELGASGELLVPPLDEKVCTLLNVTPGRLKAALQQGMHQLTALETIFEEHY